MLNHIKNKTESFKKANNLDTIDYYELDSWAYKKCTHKHINGIEIIENKNLIKQKCKIVSGEFSKIINLLGYRL